MENEGSSKPVISFPLGLVLLVLILLCLSGLFSCCYQWNKLLAFLQSSTADADDIHLDETQPPSQKIKKPEQEDDQNVTVLMPGDQFPTFVAFPTPTVTPLQMKKIIV